MGTDSSVRREIGEPALFVASLGRVRTCGPRQEQDGDGVVGAAHPLINLVEGVSTFSDLRCQKVCLPYWRPQRERR